MSIFFEIESTVQRMLELMEGPLRGSYIGELKQLRDLHRRLKGGLANEMSAPHQTLKELEKEFLALLFDNRRLRLLQFAAADSILLQSYAEVLSELEQIASGRDLTAEELKKKIDFNAMIDRVSSDRDAWLKKLETETEQ